MSTYTVKTGPDDQFTVQAQPLTLLCHRDNLNIQVVDPDVMEIDPIATVARARALTQADWDEIRTLEPFVTPFKKVFRDMDVPASLQGEGMGIQHVVGMIVMIFEAVGQGKRPFLRTPESYLHPASQSGLADMLVSMFKSKGDAGNAVH